MGCREDMIRRPIAREPIDETGGNFFRGLLFAVPLGLALWGGVIWCASFVAGLF